jgi:hypothetical protein
MGGNGDDNGCRVVDVCNSPETFSGGIPGAVPSETGASGCSSIVGVLPLSGGIFSNGCCG